MKPRYFLDTNVLIAGSAAPQTIPHAENLLTSSLADKYANEYAVKEVRRILQAKYGLRQEEVNTAANFIRQQVTVTSTPQKHEFSKLDLTDKSDKPILCSAIQLNATLVTEDHHLLMEGKKYVNTRNTLQAWQELAKQRKTRW